ncbi:ABC transporter permease [Leucobacter ruminantium]|uniref:ABC transporter permease n=1 Tax=Leucobacter ruminantium TaxID=1289170 RepID=A0A939RU79_9MICO|nr:ABC transporter permease [Leucobacter ruminantium]MBO1805400.1 ABC transporter permease [Leucobacter ruminantium]
MSTVDSARKERSGPSMGERIGMIAQDRGAQLLVLVVALVVIMMTLSAAGVTISRVNSDYLASALISFVPLALLAIAQLFVITSGKGGIDLSVGSMVSLSGMAFGISLVEWGWSVSAAAGFAVVVGILLGTINGFLTAYLGYPALITTLATYYAYRSIALVVTDQKPISGPEIQGFYQSVASIELPVIGGMLPLFPLGLFTFFLPVAVIAWLVLNRTAYGRKLYAIGTNDTAAQWAGVDTRRTRMTAFMISGLLSGLVGVYTVAQFASARPDSGTAGAGMALPAITIAVLGGVAITGGIGRLGSVALAALLITWLNASILMLVPGNGGAQVQLLALGVVLLGASLLDGWMQNRRKRGVVKPPTLTAAIALEGTENRDDEPRRRTSKEGR